MKLARLEAMLAEAKTGLDNPDDLEVVFRLKGYGVEADDAQIAIREVVAFTVGEGRPMIGGGLPTLGGLVGPGDVTSPDGTVILPPGPPISSPGLPPIFRQAKMLVIEAQ